MPFPTVVSTIRRHRQWQQILFPRSRCRHQLTIRLHLPRLLRHSMAIRSEDIHNHINTVKAHDSMSPLLVLTHCHTGTFILVHQKLLRCMIECWTLKHFVLMQQPKSSPVTIGLRNWVSGWQNEIHQPLYQSKRIGIDPHCPTMKHDGRWYYIGVDIYDIYRL